MVRGARSIGEGFGKYPTWPRGSARDNAGAERAWCSERPGHWLSTPHLPVRLVPSAQVRGGAP
jgi:hypothetical protein